MRIIRHSEGVYTNADGVGPEACQGHRAGVMTARSSGSIALTAHSCGLPQLKKAAPSQTKFVKEGKSDDLS